MLQKLFYEEIGHGNPLICLHGYALDHTIWLEMVDELKSDARIILPDLRGHGKSPAPEGKYSMRVMAEDVLEIMDSLRLERANIAGHSMGGYIALALAEYYPDRLSGLALVASHAYADVPEKKKARLDDIERVKHSSPAEVLSEMPGKLSRNLEVVERCKNLIFQTSKNGVMGVLAGMAERPDRIEAMALLKIPTLVVAGTDDQFIPLETSREMSAKVKGMQLFEIINVGHMPMMEHPQDTAKALLNLFN